MTHRRSTELGLIGLAVALLLILERYALPYLWVMVLATAARMNGCRVALAAAHRNPQDW
jgi:hypothetical protein